jgi:hypothetical protein
MSASEKPALRELEQEYERLCAEPSDINELLPVLRFYAARCASVTEFGMRGGVSTAAFIAAGPSSLNSYDIVRDEEALRRLSPLAQAAGVDFRFHERSVLSTLIAPTELLFIDTWHVYDQLIRELLLHSWRVSRFILLHDTTTFGEHGERRPGDYRNRIGPPRRGLWPAVEQFLRLARRWKLRERLMHNNGLTVLERAR